MFFLEADGSLHTVFNASFTLDQLLANFEDAINGQPLLQLAYLLLYPNLPCEYFSQGFNSRQFFTV
jgi:hypothetical protein